MIAFRCLLDGRRGNGIEWNLKIAIELSPFFGEGGDTMIEEVRAEEKTKLFDWKGNGLFKWMDGFGPTASNGKGGSKENVFTKKAKGVGGK